MKDFCKKHTVIFTLGIILIAIFSKLVTDFLRSFFPENRMMYFLMEAIVQFSVSAILFIFMVKLGYTKKADKKNIALGFALCSIMLLFMLYNIIPFILINPILLDIQWGNLVAIILLFLSVGLIEEISMRGLLLPLFCEKWKDKKHFYLKAAILTSFIFGVIHLNGSVKYFITHGYMPPDQLVGNILQVIWATGFGLFAAGITMYTRNIISIILFHALWDIPALLIYGLVPYASAEFYVRQQMLTLERVFDKYGILPDFPFAATLIFYLIELAYIIIGIILILKAEKKYTKTN